MLIKTTFLSSKGMRFTVKIKDFKITVTRRVTIMGFALACLLFFLLRKNKRSTSMVSQRETIKGFALA